MILLAKNVDKIQGKECTNISKKTFKELNI